MKKFLTLTLLCFLSVMAWGASSGTVGDYAYSFNDDYTATISGFGYGVSGITEMEIPETVTYSGYEYTVTKISHDMCNAPNYYSAILTEVIIPKSIVEIGYRAFNGQTSLSTIYCYAEEVPELTSSNGTENVFNNVTATVYVPAASVNAYQEAWGEKYSGLTFVALDGDTGDSGDHEGDYLTVEIMGFDVSSSSKQDVTYDGALSGTEYQAYCYAGVLNESTGVDFTGDFNISSGGDYIRNNSSVGYLRKVIIEGDENYTGGYSLSVRVANEPYTGSSYSAFSSYGVEVAQISAKDGGSVELSDDYQYFAVSHVNSWDSATRFKSIELIWETEGGSDTGGSSNHEYSIDPDPDVEQSSLQNFTFTCYDGICGNDQWYADYNGTVSIYKDGSSEPYATTTDIEGDWDSNVSFDYDVYLYINFKEEITEAGEYELVIPAGLFNWYDENNPTLNEEIRFSYTVEGSGDTGGSDAPYTVEPDEDVVQQSLSYVKFIAEGAICYSEEIEASEVKVYKDEVEVASGASVQDDYTSGTWDDAVNIYFDTTLVEAGEYKVVVPAGFMNLGSWTVYNDEITLNYTVDGSLDTGGTGSGDHEGDYLTVEIMGFDVSSSSKQDVTYDGALSGTEYQAYCYAGVLNESTGVDFTGDFNISSGGDYIRNNSSVGYLRKVIIEGDENYTGGYSLSVRVANEPYTGSSYSAFSSYGVEVAQISAKDGGSVELSDDYQYFAVSHVNSWDSATRFKSIELVWDAEGGGDTGGSGTFSCTIDPDPEAGSVDDLSQITFSNEYGIYYNEEGENGYDDDPIVIYDSEDNPVSYIDNITPILSSDEEAEVGQIVTFEPVVTEAGDYTVVVPASFFYSIDENGYKGYNDELKLSYTFEGASQETGGVPEGYVLDPADQAEVPTLSEIIISLESDNITCGSNFATVVVKNEEDQEVTTITLDDETDYGKVICTLDNGGISTAGTYTITFPEGVLLDWRTIDPNPEFTVTYYVTGETSTGGDHEGDYLTVEIMGFDVSSSSKQDVTYDGALSGTEYQAYCYAGVLNESTGVDFTGDFNISSGGDYIRNNSSVGYLRKVIIEGDENYTGGYSLSVRVANEPYTGSSYSAFSSYGVEVAQISAKDGGSVELSDDYQYFAVSHVNSWDSATRFKSIELIWETEGSGNSGSGVPEGYTVEPAEGEVGSLTEIIFSCTDGSSLSDYGISYTQSLQEQFTVVDESGDVVATYGSLDEIEISDGVYKMGIVLSASVTDAGSYTVNVPAGAFLSWSDFEPNPAFTIHYTVTGNTGGSGNELVVDPESGETLESLSEFSITCAEGLGLNNMDDPLYVKKDGDVVAHAWGDTPIMDGVSYIGYNFVICDPTTEADLTLTDEGEYTIEVPDEYFVFDDESLSEGFTIVYTIGGGSDTGGVTHHEYDYLTPEIMGFDLASGSKQTITYDGAPSGTEYGAVCFVGVLNESTGVDFTGDFNISSSGDYIRNNSSVGYLREVIIEGDENYTSGYSLSVRVANEPYTGSSYSSFSSYGEEVAQISAKDGGSVELSDDYQYFAVSHVGEWDSATRFKSIELVWEVEGFGTPSYVVDPAEGEVESLSVIEFSSDDENVDGFLGNYDYALYTQEALVYSRLNRGEPITTATLEGGGELDDYDSSIIITLKEEISEPGSYIVVIPEGSFYWIVNDEPYLNDEIDLSYYIEAPQGEYSYDPADGETLSSLLTFTVYNSEGIDPSYNYEGEITVEDESGAVVAYDIDCEPNYPDSYDEPTPSCTITLNTEIVEPGTYTITIPEGYFVVGSYYANSKELVISYIIEEGSDSGSDVPEGYIIDPEDGSTLESLYTINIAYDGGDVTVDSSLRKDDSVKASLKVVDDESGETVATLDSYEMVKDDNGYQTYDLTFTSEITSSGSYTITIPAGVFYDPNYVACEEFHIHYTIEVNPGTGTGINGFSINSENVEGIYSTSGQKLNKTQKGVNIIRFSDGTVKKLYVK